MDKPITSPLPPLITDPVPSQAKPSLVQFERGFTLSVNAQENLSMSKAGAFIVRAGKDLDLTNGGAFTIVSGGNFKLVNGGAQTMVVGGNMEITNGGATLVIPGGNLTVNKSFVGIALAKEAHVNEGGRVILDTPRALAFGAAFGAVYALVRWLLKR